MLLLLKIIVLEIFEYSFGKWMNDVKYMGKKIRIQHTWVLTSNSIIKLLYKFNEHCNWYDQIIPIWANVIVDNNWKLFLLCRQLRRRRRRRQATRANVPSRRRAPPMTPPPPRAPRRWPRRRGGGRARPSRWSRSAAWSELSRGTPTWARRTRRSSAANSTCPTNRSLASISVY